ncbi:hypothetical protein ASF57_23020 [Methylobacterium sp. Leaf117]|nr:hypothetical protein ASF57_23020 [Methylobacterium sp. Leaf117]
MRLNHRTAGVARFVPCRQGDFLPVFGFSQSISFGTLASFLAASSLGGIDGLTIAPTVAGEAEKRRHVIAASIKWVACIGADHEPVRVVRGQSHFEAIVAAAMPRTRAPNFRANDLAAERACDGVESEAAAHRADPMICTAGVQFSALCH